MKAIFKVSEEAGAVDEDLMPEPGPARSREMGASGCYGNVMIYKGL